MNSLIEQINSAGKSFIGFSLPMLVQSSILILILLAADFLLRKKVRAVFRYCIWMLVLVKLVIPPSISTPVGIGNLFGDKLTEIKISSTEITPVQKEQALIQIPQLTILSPKPELYKEIYPQRTDIRSLEWQKEEQKPAAESVTWQGALFAGWVVVVLVLIILLLQRAVFVNGLVKQADEVTGGLNDVIQSCCKHINIKNKIRLKISANAVSPAVCGLFRPVILLPTNLIPNLSKSQIKAVLLHELVHIKRGDLWINLFQTLLQIVYFYNPFLWLANAIIRRIREQAVDEAVQVALAESAESYPKILVDVAKLAFRHPVLSLRLIGVVESKSALKSRIARMLSLPIPKKAKLGIAGLLIIVIAGLILLPMAAAKVGEPTLVIKGTVTNLATEEPIAGAKVFDDGYGPGPDWQKVKAGEQFEWGAITDSNGQYSFLTWPEHHTIKVESDGYESQNKSLYSSHFTLNKKNEEIFDFALTPVSKFSATLPNGVMVELVGVCEHPSEGKEWWQPDGSPLETRPYEKFYSANSAGDKGYEIAYRIAANEGVVYEIKADNQTGSAGTDILKEEKQLLSEFNNGQYYGGVFFIPQNFNKTDVRIGTGLEKNFKTICTQEGDVSKTMVNCENVFLYPAIEAEGKTYISAEYHFTEGRKDAFRLIAIDTNDKQHLIKQGMRSESKQMVHCRMSIDLPVKQIKSIHFQTQPLQWITFKNVSLVPGQKTDVQIEVEINAGQVERENKSATQAANVPEDVQQIDKVLQQWFKACRADDIEQAKKLLAPNSQPLEQNLQFTKMILQVIADDLLIPAKVIQFEHGGITGAWAAFVTENGFFFTGELSFITATLQKVKDNWLIAGIAFSKPEEFEETITSTKKQFPDADIWQSDSFSNLADKTNALLKRKAQAFEKTGWNQLEGAPQAIHQKYWWSDIRTNSC